MLYVDDNTHGEVFNQINIRGGESEDCSAESLIFYKCAIILMPLTTGK